MKLYFSPGACSLAPHIALHELGLPFNALKVDLKTHKVADGTDYYTVNPKGYVPVLELDDGERLTEAAVILQYIADRKPGTLAPAFGTMERYRLMEWLNFISTEVHKQFGPLWYPTTPDATKEAQKAKLATRFEHISKTLAKQPYLTGEEFTIADAYLFTIVNWSGMLGVDISGFPALQQFQARVAARPKVQRAMREEGLIKDPAPGKASAPANAPATA
jgi:glutathione S-transferase